MKDEKIESKFWEKLNQVISISLVQLSFRYY